MARADFADRCVLVTGATGMAAAASRALARAGAQVFLISRTPAHLEALAAEVRAEGGRCAWQAADLGDEGQVEAAFAALDRACGRLDAAFGAAGISGRRFGDGPLHEVTSAGWETVLRSNTTSQFLVARAALRRMLAQPPDSAGSRGSILLMSSTLAMHPAAAFFGTHAYAASKGAIEGLTRALAAYYAPSGIRVNAIAPGLVATPMSRRAQTDPAVASYLVDKQPLAQGAIAADAVAATVVHLLGDGARMITGQVVAVDAGWSVSEPRPSADQPPS